MKQLFLSFTALFLFSQGHAAEFGAFVKSDTLYLTIIGDGCNEYTADLKVSESCLESRTTELQVDVCSVEVLMVKTKHMCAAWAPTPIVFEFDLKAMDIAEEATKIALTYGTETTLLKK